MIDSLTDSELLEFLFLPDLSTRDDVSELSGRGVGLDVVRDIAKELGGVVTANNNPGQGVEFVMMLPLSLSVMSALLVDIADEPYAFPLSKVDRVLKILPEEVLEMEGRQYITLDNKNIGLISGVQVLGFESTSTVNEQLTVVIISDRMDQYALVVDRYIDQRQLSVHALDSRLGKIPNVSSASLLENGDPLFILDVDDIVRSIHHIVTDGRLGDVYQLVEEKLKIAKKRILVVDDSLTVREVERDLLQSKGYLVDVAVDGMDGWNAVRRSTYDLIVTDVDMPRMDGIELVSSIKQDLHLKNIPVMIVSYKDRVEDRRRGLDAGADYYLSKGSFHDDSLIDAVEDLIGEAEK
jgi:two-component system sensor histidine kinase and response regulator WspE